MGVNLAACELLRKVSVSQSGEWKVMGVLTAGADALVGLAVLTKTVVLWSCVRSRSEREGLKGQTSGLVVRHDG